MTSGILMLDAGQLLRDIEHMEQYWNPAELKRADIRKAVAMFDLTASKARELGRKFRSELESATFEVEAQDISKGDRLLWGEKLEEVTVDRVDPLPDGRLYVVAWFQAEAGVVFATVKPTDTFKASVS